MALKDCFSCGQPVSYEDRICPSCEISLDGDATVADDQTLGNLLAEHLSQDAAVEEGDSKGSPSSGSSERISVSPKPEKPPNGHPKGDSDMDIVGRIKKNPIWLLVAIIPVGVVGMCAAGLGIAFLSVILGSGEPLDPDCTMNGRGYGHCTFVNTGSRTNSACGHILAVCTTLGTDPSQSSTFCSGDVESGESKTHEFRVPEFDRITPNYGDWRDSCGFDWIPAN